ncbi:MAG TPA: Ni/Fe hydrogenase subunit alpha [Acetobacteraceae bacterium]|jgi:NAD-reducing hydrogenase large subunit
MKTIVIDPVTRIEGHAKITIQLDDEGRVTETAFHVTQFRGFEKFCEGRPYYEMPAITSRICGICPISHLITSAKACEAIMSVRVPPTAAKLREIMHCGQVIQSHALSFFHLSAPDLLLGFDSDPARRNIVGVIEDHPQLARDGIALRRFGQQVIEGLAGERVHPSWAVPGGVNAPLEIAGRDRILAALPEAKAIALRTLELFKGIVDRFSDEIAVFGNAPTMYSGLIDDSGNLQLYDGHLRFIDAAGKVVVDRMPAQDFEQFVGEATVAHSFLKAPYFRQLGYPDGVFRVGPLARLNVVARCGTEAADAEFAEYHQRCGDIAQSSFHYHYARLVEIIYCIERMEVLLHDASILDRHVRARAGVNALEGIGMAEAPRGTLIHHYKVNEDGAITWANLIIATGNNNLAIGRSINQVSRHYVDGNRLQDGMLNRVQAVLRAYDPCLSCSTHAAGQYPVEIRLIDAAGSVLDSMRN